MYRPSYIEVNGNILENNVKNIISNYNNYDYYIGVVKNNAYHHGIYSVKYLIKGGVNYLAVSSLEEAIEIRKYGIKIPILCLEPVNIEFIDDVINNNVTITIESLKYVEELIKLKLFDTLKIHIKVDSGMNRLGFKDKNELLKALNLLSDKKGVVVEGIYSHFATSGIKDPFYNEQINNFLEITSLIDLKKFNIVHFDRSFTLVLHDKLDFVNGVRIGISMYGYEQKMDIKGFLKNAKLHHLQNKYKIKGVHLNNSLSLNYAFSLYSEVISLRKVNADEFAGYGALYRFKDSGVVATIPVGYADGVLKDFKYVFINNVKYEIIAECMDMLLVLVDNNVKIGDKVEVIGKNQNIKQLGDRLSLNGHKFLNLFSNRLPIVYKYNKEKYEIKY